MQQLREKESKMEPREAERLPLLPQAQRLFGAACFRSETNVTFSLL